MEHASMTDGHRCLFGGHRETDSPLEFAFMTRSCIERCGTVARCIKQTIPDELPKNAMVANMLRDGGDEHDTGAVHDETQETREVVPSTSEVPTKGSPMSFDGGLCGR